jgi:L-fuconolactonase
MTAVAKIDAHFHCWQLARGDYGWLTQDLAPIYRDVAIADWQAQSAPHGVSGGVLVQAAPTEAETQFLLAQADANPAVLGVVGWVDFLAADAPARIEKLARQPAPEGLAAHAARHRRCRMDGATCAGPGPARHGRLRPGV